MFGFSEKKGKNNKFESLVVSLSFFPSFKQKKKKMKTELDSAERCCCVEVLFVFLLFIYFFSFSHMTKNLDFTSFLLAGTNWRGCWLLFD